MYHKKKVLNQAPEFLEQSLEMLRIVYSQNSLHPHIRKVLHSLADVYEDQGRQDEATAIRRNERNNETGKTGNCEALNPASGA